MRKLALTDDILLKIEKPARYIGHEVNSVMKDKKAVDIRFAMCFPEVYEVGMSHLGIHYEGYACSCENRHMYDLLTKIELSYIV